MTEEQGAEVLAWLEAQAAWMELMPLLQVVVVLGVGIALGLLVATIVGIAGRS